MAAVSYDADVALYEAGGNSIAGRAHSWEDWIKLVRLFLPDRARLLDLSRHFNVPVRTLKEWKVSAMKDGVVANDLPAVQAFVLKTKGMRLAKPEAESRPLKYADQLKYFRQVLQPGAPLQSLSTVLNVPRSQLARAKATCVKEKVSWSSDYCLREFLEANDILRTAEGAKAPLRLSKKYGKKRRPALAAEADRPETPEEEGGADSACPKTRGAPSEVDRPGTLEEGGVDSVCL